MILDRIKRLAQENGQEIAFTFLDKGENVELTFGEIFEKASSLAVSLKRNGLREGERILILADQSPENVIAVIGSMLAKGVFVMVPPPVDEGKRKRLQSVLKACEPKCCLVSHDLLEKMTERVLTEMLGRTVCLLNVNKQKDSVTEEIDLTRKQDDLVYIQFTSGSTSEPKGVMVDYGNLMSSLYDSGASIPREQARIGLSWLPFYHNIGLLCVILRNFYNHTHFYIMKPESFLKEPMSWFENCAKYKVQFTAGPNSAFALCANAITDDIARKMDLSRLRYVLNGSEPINYKTLQAFAYKFRLTGLDISCFCPAYGLAEVVCGVTTASGGVKITEIDFDSYKKNKFVPAVEGKKSKILISQGSLFSNTQVCIVDPSTLTLCKDNEIGEIWITGDSVARGYWNVSREKDSTFHQHLHGDDKEYLRTGDYGIVYKDELYVTGRIKEVLIVNGHNIYPNDIVNDLYHQISVLCGCSFAIFQTEIDEKERVILCIEGQFQDEITYERLVKQIKRVMQVAYDVSPYDIVFCKPNSFPRTDNKKVKNALVKEYYCMGLLQCLHSSCASVSIAEVETEMDAVEWRIKNIFESILKIKVKSRDDDFLALGGNSFDSVELVHMLKSEFDVELELNDVLEHAKVKELSLLIKQKKKHGEVFVSKFNLYEDVVLPDDIQIPGTYEKELSQCQTVFLTGTTGFLGAYLIQSYLEQTNMKLFCHVRAESEEAGLQRICENMRHYELWKDDYEKRIVAIPGDLKSDKLGMSDEWYEKVANEADVILHNGALLHFLYPYSYMAETNVKSTVDCIRLACTGRVKYMGYVSTFSVYDNPSHLHKHVMEDDLLTSSEGYLLPYSETKWVSEKILEKARERGVRTIVFRPGEITGSTATGKWNFGDMVSRSIVASLETGQIPSPFSNLYMTPVDYIADAIVYMMRQDTVWNHAYNLVNQKIMSGDELCRMAKKMGYSIHIVPYEKWRQQLFESKDEDNALKVLENLFGADMEDESCIIRRYSDAEPTFDVSNTMKVLKNSGITCPPLSEELVEKYIRNFVEQGVLSK